MKIFNSWCWSYQTPLYSKVMCQLTRWGIWELREEGGQYAEGKVAHPRYWFRLDGGLRREYKTTQDMLRELNKRKR